MFKISDDEKTYLMDNCDDYFKDENGRILFKILANYLLNIADMNQLRNLDDSIFEDENKFKELSELIMKVLIEGATKK